MNPDPYTNQYNTDVVYQENVQNRPVFLQGDCGVPDLSQQTNSCTQHCKRTHGQLSRSSSMVQQDQNEEGLCILDGFLSMAQQDEDEEGLFFLNQF